MSDTGGTEDGAAHTGGCLCGAVRYRTTGALRPVVNCHCAMCRRFHGHVGAYTNVPQARFAYMGEGRPTWFQSSDFGRRAFCATCGASLFWQRLGGTEISIAAGTLDAPTGLATTSHIFTADKGDYYAITDDLPRS